MSLRWRYRSLPKPPKFWIQNRQIGLITPQIQDLWILIQDLTRREGTQEGSTETRPSCRQGQRCRPQTKGVETRQQNTSITSISSYEDEERTYNCVYMELHTSWVARCDMRPWRTASLLLRLAFNFSARLATSVQPVLSTRELDHMRQSKTCNNVLNSFNIHSFNSQCSGSNV
jgi:hypothetical protein